MKICYRDKKFHAKSLKLIALCNSIIDEWNAKGYSLTLRQLYYQLVSRAVISNNEKSYDNVGAMLSDARLAGLVDWDAIEDRTRNLRALPHWNRPAEIIAGAAKQFNYDRWEGQPTRVEVWVEKDALVDVVARECNKYDVPFFSCRGYTSQSEMWGAAQRINNYTTMQARNVVLLHLGDHDPSGLDMTRDITERLELFCESDGYPAPTVKRIALNMDQIHQYNPPPNPAKLTDCRVAKYIAAHGHESWELDALQPDVIGALIRKHIDALVDQPLFDAATARQEAARAELSEISSDYDALLTGKRALAQLADVLRPEISLEQYPEEVQSLIDLNTETFCKLDSTTADLHKAIALIETLQTDLAKAKTKKNKRPYELKKRRKDGPKG